MHLKLIPFFKPLAKDAEDEMDEPEDLRKRKTTEKYDNKVKLPKKADPSKGHFHLFQDTISITLLDQKKCTEILKNEESDSFNDLILFTFVGKYQAKQDINENSFIIIANDCIHVFNEKRIESARISGVKIVSATLIDS